jgi:hypothetical protein
MQQLTVYVPRVITDLQRQGCVSVLTALKLTVLNGQRGRKMDKFITIEYTEGKLIVGYICAKNEVDAHNEVVNSGADPSGELLVFAATKTNQLIIDLNKMARKI